MVYDVKTREADVTALDTGLALTELGALSPGAIVAPSSKKITSIKIGTGVDWTADAHFGFTCSVSLSGGGIGPGFQNYPGPAGASTGAGGNTSGITLERAVTHKVNIDVNPGQHINPVGYIYGEDVGSMRIAVSLEFDGWPGVVTSMDLREGNLTAANTFVRLTDRNGATENDMTPGAGSKIAEIFLNNGVKAVAGPLGTVIETEFLGDAVLNSGDYQFQSHGISTSDDIAVGGSATLNTGIRYSTGPRGITLKSGTLGFQAQEIEDDVGTIMTIIGVGFM